jgi:hypothetical protein
MLFLSPVTFCFTKQLESLGFKFVVCQVTAIDIRYYIYGNSRFIVSKRAMERLLYSHKNNREEKTTFKLSVAVAIFNWQAHRYLNKYRCCKQPNCDFLPCIREWRCRPRWSFLFKLFCIINYRNKYYYYYLLSTDTPINRPISRRCYKRRADVVFAIYSI